MKKSQLEVIAYMSMLIDHSAASLLKIYMKSDMYTGYILGMKGELVYDILRGIGRVAFVVFAYYIAMGMVQSRNKKRYLGRLAIFALVSEIPFDIAMFNAWFDRTHQNVGFTLLFGALAIYFIQRFENRKVVQIVLTIIIMVAAGICRTDYSFGGVFLIVVIYCLRDDYYKMVPISFIGFMILLGINATIKNVLNAPPDYLTMELVVDKLMKNWEYYFTHEIYGIVAFVLIQLTSKERIRSNGLLRAVKYLFYPVHLLLIAVLEFVLLDIVPVLAKL